MAFAGGTAATIAAIDAAIEALIEEITDLLMEAAEEYLDGAIDAAEDLLDQAIDKYFDLLTEHSKLGGLARWLTCVAVAGTAADIFDFAMNHPKTEGVKLVSEGLCTLFIEPYKKWW